MSHPTTTQTQFLTLRSQGLSYDKIAQDLHVSKHTLLDWAQEFRPPIDARLQSALHTYHAALTHRAEALAQQFQTIAQNITTCDIKSSNYPRLLNLLLKLHKALQEFDFNPAALPIQNPKSEIQNSSNPAALPEDSTKTAPTYDLETDSTVSAPEPPLTARLAERSDPAGTETALEPSSTPPSSPPIQNPSAAGTETTPEPSVVPPASPSIQNPKTCPEYFEGSKIQNSCESSEARVLKFIDRYRKHFNAEPPEHVFSHLKNVRKEVNRQAS